MSDSVAASGGSGSGVDEEDGVEVGKVAEAPAIAHEAEAETRERYI